MVVCRELTVLIYSVKCALPSVVRKPAAGTIIQLNMDPKNKYALVTGAASGLGLAMTRELLKNGLQGVIIADINDIVGKELCKNLETEFKTSKVRFIRTDVAKEDEYEAAFQEAISVFGQLDIVINNAGILNDKEYTKEMNINFGGVLYGTLLGMKYLGKDKLGKGGIILNIASIAAVENIHVCPIYSACKSGVLNLSLGLGNPYYFNRSGVRVVALCPAGTDTPLFENCNILDESLQVFKEITAVTVMQKPAVVGHAALYLIKNAQTGTGWIVEMDKLYKLEMPKWQDYSTNVKNFF